VCQYVHLFWCLSLTCTLTTNIPCMQTNCPFSARQTSTRTCTFKGSSSTPLEWRHGGRSWHELVSSSRRAPCRWSRAGATSPHPRGGALGRRHADPGPLTAQHLNESHVPLAPEGHGDPLAISRVLVGTRVPNVNPLSWTSFIDQQINVGTYRICDGRRQFRRILPAYRFRVRTSISHPPSSRQFWFFELTI
jgi:hypothetical protein